MENIAMRIAIFIFLTAFASAEQQYTRENMPGAQFYDGKKIKIPISDESAYDMYERWTFQGISSIMSAIANQKVENLNEFHRNKLYKCTQKALDIHEHADCVVTAMDAARHGRTNSGSHHRSALNARSEDVRPSLNGAIFSNDREDVHRVPVGEKSSRSSSSMPNRSRVETPVVEYRSKRDVVRKANYKLRTEYEHFTPFGVIGKYLSQTIKQIKHKPKDKSWSSTIAEVQLLKKKIEQRTNNKNYLKKRFKFAKYGVDKYFSSNRLTEMESTLGDNAMMHDSMTNQQESEDDIRDKQTNLTMNLLRGAMKVAMAISGDNSSMNRTLKIASPRLLSLMPEEDDNEVALVSPSLFSLHNKGKGTEAMLSLPHMMRSTNNTDYEQWLNFIIEASGVSDAVDSVMKKDETRLSTNFMNEYRGIDNQPMYWSKENVTETKGDFEGKKIELLETLQKTLSRKQLIEFNTTGFSILSKEQLKFVYGTDSPFNNSKAYDRFLGMDEWTIRKALLQNIRDLAKLKHRGDFSGVRKKRFVLDPLSFLLVINGGDALSQPLILSPVLFALVILTPAIFGPVILSPWIFVTLILSPRIMSPVILAPVALSTAILTPVCMNPLVLSPGALVPFILSPLVLSPNVLSPSVMSPAILSPFALGGNLFNPVAGTALILSPFAIAPSVFSPAYVAAIILSPHIFSPLINSTGKAVTLVLSPSAFS